MKVMIVGHTSMIGEALVAGLRGRGECLTAGRRHADVPFDATGDALPDVPGACEAAVLCAASFGGDDESGILANARVNALGSLRAAMLAARAGCGHVVYLSSLSSIAHPENGAQGSYGLSKRQGQENVALYCAARGIPCTALLLSQVYDAAGKARRHQPMLYRLLDCARAGQEVVLHGRRDPLRNYLYLDDVVDIVRRVLERRVAGVFPCVHPRSHRLSEVARAAFRTFGQPERIRWLPDRPDIATLFIPQDLGLYARLEYTPETDLEAGMAGIRKAGAA